MKHNKNNGSNVPNLRFPEFTGEWKRTTLGNISEYVKDRIMTCSLSPNNYISTENLIQNFQGAGIAFSIPTNTSVTSYSVNDILFSNIRPYLKKSWKANMNGGCSTDVFVFRHNIDCLPDFLYYLIANDDFVNYVMTGAKGVKMPRGDKQQITQYPVYLPTKPEQSKITSLLTLIDERISTQNKIIAHLESLIKGLCLDVYERCEKIPYKISEIGHKHTTINLSKEELSDNGRNCIIYGELFTTYGCVIDVVQSKTTKNCTPKSLSKGNDILFPSSTTVDATSLISPSALKEVGVVLGGDMFSINVNNSHNCEAISYIINNVLKNKLARYAQGSTIIHIYYDDIKDYTLMLPVKEKQNLLANIMHCISTKISTEKDILSFYLQQKGYLLQNMFI